MRVVATAGHVDHGKSTLLRALTGMEPDRWAEERRRGLTIDLGFVWTRLTASDGSHVTVAFVDVPGHERFVANMLAGAGAAPAVLFVVAADDGWSAQSQEHLDIIDILGVAGLAVAITKADVAGAERATQVMSDVRQRVAGTRLEGAPVLITDALTGQGLGALGRVLADRCADLPTPRDGGRPRLWIDRAFSITGAGTVITGTLAGGSLRVGQRVRLLPGGKEARIRGLEALGEEIEAIGPGSRIGVNLSGLRGNEVARGGALVEVGAAWAEGSSPDVLVQALPGHRIRATGAWHIHVGTAHATATMHPLLGDIEPGQSGFARLELDSVLPLQHGDRLVIREAGRRQTVAGGFVLDPRPKRRARGTSERLAHAERLERIAQSAETADLVEALLDCTQGWSHVADIQARAGLTALQKSTRLAALNDTVVTIDRLATWQNPIVEEVAQQSPHVGTSLDQLESIAERIDCPRKLVRPIVKSLCDEGTLVQHRNVVVTPEQEPMYLAARDARRTAFLDALNAAPLQPPDPDELVRTIGMPAHELQALVDHGEIIWSEDLVFGKPAVDDAIRRLTAAVADKTGFTASEAREILGTSRKYVMPLLEHLAARGVTTFDGTHHQLHRGTPPQ